MQSEHQKSNMKSEKKLKTAPKNLVIDAQGAVLGRLAAQIAKELVNGNHVDVLNIETTVISGRPKEIVQIYVKRRGIKNWSNPTHASKWPRRPDYLFKRIVQGMLPKNSRGFRCLKQLTAHVGVPAGIKAESTLKPSKNVSELKGDYITLKDLSHQLGWIAHA